MVEVEGLRQIGNLIKILVGAVGLPLVVVILEAVIRDRLTQPPPLSFANKPKGNL